jgi:hypothetical protein
MVEANPWYKNLPDGASFPACYGAVGVKADGGGSMAGRGRVGPMRLHRAANLRDAAALQAALAAGDDANEVESVRTTPCPCACRLLRGLQRGRRGAAGCGARGGARQRCCCVRAPPRTDVPSGSRRLCQAGNTPLHNAAYEGWLEGCQLLLEAGAKVNASNNVRPRAQPSAPRPFASPAPTRLAAAPD